MSTAFILIRIRYTRLFKNIFLIEFRDCILYPFVINVTSINIIDQSIL